MTTPRHGDDAPGELDPTGVRALLSSLPDPGPMPGDLVARISTSLREEQQRREFSATAPHTDVISLAAERHVRRPGRTLAWLGSAAAVAVAATVAVSQLWGGGMGESADTAAQYPAAEGGSTAGASAGDATEDAADEAADDAEGEALDDAGGDAGAEGDGAAEENGAATTEAGETTTPGEAAPQPAAGGTALSLLGPVTLTGDDVSQELSTWLAESSTGLDEASDDSLYASCLALLPGQPAAATYGVGPGRLDGRQDVVAVVRMTPPPRQGWVLDARCRTGDGGVLLGPVALP